MDINIIKFGIAFIGFGLSRMLSNSQKVGVVTGIGTILFLEKSETGQQFLKDTHSDFTSSIIIEENS